jgi:hypothetical protein
MTTPTDNTPTTKRKPKEIIEAKHHEMLLGRMNLLKVSPTAKAVLMAIIEFTSPDPQRGWIAFPSYPTLMEVAQIGNRNTLAKHLKTLEQEGLIWKQWQKKKVTIYHLTTKLFELLRLRSNVPLWKPRNESHQPEPTGGMDIPNDTGGHLFDELDENEPRKLVDPRIAPDPIVVADEDEEDF